METVRFVKKNSLDVVKRAVFFLRHGGVILYPTETLYGLGVDAWKKSAVKRVRRIKKIALEDRPFLILAPSFEIVEQWAYFSPAAKNIAKKYWPGPLTIILPLKKSFFSKFYHLSKENTIALRVSSHPFLLTLFTMFHHPLVSTSANLTGKKPVKNIREAHEWFSRGQDRPDLLIDAGPMLNTLPSTIIDGRNRKLRVLRKGQIQL